MSKVIYSGFYGFHNSGDDVFLETTAWATKNLMNDMLPVYFGNSLPELLNPYNEFSKINFKGHDRLLAAFELRNAEYFISAGGSTFSRHKKNSYKEIAEYAKQFYNKRLKTGAIGVSIGPFMSKKDECNVQEYLQKMNFLAVRDRRSYEYVSQLDLPYEPVEAFDLAALLPLVYSEIPFVKDNNFDDKKIIGISVCPVESITDKSKLGKENQRNKNIKELIKALNSLHDNLVFRFFVINGHKNIGDEGLTNQMIKDLGISNYEIVPYQNKVYNVWSSIKNCDFMIATRLHAGIIAAYADVPFILNEYHQKCTDFICDIGQNNDLLVGDAEYDLAKVTRNISNILFHKGEYKLSKKEKTQEMSLRNFSFINNY
ncbi:polysaccharide pyruvyl transferase family protein [Myroides odoratimimus]|uniref:polysaccharide pyruvyl transferase family protein n=1 Tax=Myroides odoratimimus TaxID=76832 RepID=UPI0025783B59|nr:polysaccharide pyruvyl transferase family protein [Myroides odoratimimus]MDM1454779.1 polysaccharide pyruvyl transferase family protein [Myroides odoratimimus]MDM1478498.1 polysaccharide pyruvyl transferase family protein [Myroides odoratimimus]MDM1490828.1 polysaccharide pyruvyl transferase family protein [Myroides odoratimimus]